MRGGSRVVIVDCGIGNLFSVRRACESAGLDALVTSDQESVAQADGIVLPGVGAFGDAMAVLAGSGMASSIRASVARGVPLLGICLGIQLLMEESLEFGVHRGLGILEGTVERLKLGEEAGRRVKVPHVGWNRIEPPAAADSPDWHDCLLADNQPGDFMYFVHSYVARPVHEGVVRAVAHYGGQTFCAAIQKDNVFACQFHPERSGPAGLKVYARFADRVRRAAEDVRA